MDTTMTFSYTWADAEQTILKREDTDGNVAFVPTDPANRDYAEFLASGATAAPYVAPPAPAEPTLTEKLAAAGINPADLISLLEQESGVSVDEIKAAASR